MDRFDHVHLYGSPREALVAAARAVGVTPAIGQLKQGWTLWVEHVHDEEIIKIIDGLSLTGYQVARTLGYMEQITVLAC